MTTFIVIVHVIVCLMLILVILLQAGRGQGLSGPSFGSGNVQSLFGTGAADFLTKATSVAAICFILTSLTLDFIESRKNRSLLDFGRQTSTVDVDSIKKALERVKQEEKTAAKVPAETNVAASAVQDKTAAAVTQAVEKVEKAVSPETMQAAQQAVAEKTKQTAESALPATDQSASANSPQATANPQ